MYMTKLVDVDNSYVTEILDTVVHLKTKSRVQRNTAMRAAVMRSLSSCVQWARPPVLVVPGEVAVRRVESVSLNFLH